MDLPQLQLGIAAKPALRWGGRMDKTRWFILAVGLYIAIAAMVYAFRHPELTETQRFLHLIDAVLWRE